MRREEFMSKLRTELSKLPQEEREAALEYYTEYFDEAGPEKEDEVLKELGSPRQVAAQIKSAYAVRLFDEEEKPTVKKGLSTAWYVIIGICSAPIAVPAAVCFGILASAGLLAALAIMVGILACLLISFVAGAVSVYIGFTMFSASASTALMLLGGGIFIMALSVMLSALLILATRKIMKLVAHSGRKRRERKRVQRILREGAEKKQAEGKGAFTENENRQQVNVEKNKEESTERGDEHA